jgi:pyruvate-ferredoxin/flavodoxin oxidoreductase
MSDSFLTVDGNEAVARVAYRASEIIAIYPITPSTPMGEYADAWAAAGQPNLWGSVPRIIEMQSEGGAAGAIHGAVQTGALATTFTASQGLLLMIPNMYKIAGELTPVVFHVASRAIATQALSIFGDHSDVMATRATGFALLSSHSVQAAQDLAAIAHAATLAARVPFIHFCDGFRTSHEIAKIVALPDETLRALLDPTAIAAHRQRALSPDHPFIRGTAHNPDTYFQARETVNPYYQRCPEIVQATMNTFAALTGRQYHLFEYVGASDATDVIVVMGSAAETVRATVEHLNTLGAKVGAVIVHLYRPFATEAFLRVLPATVRSIAVLDRTKEPGGIGEPLFLDVVAAIQEGMQTGIAPIAHPPRIIGGRYGIGSKEFTPGMVQAIFAELSKAQPKPHFTVGIVDDVTHASLDYDANFTLADDATLQCVFWGLGSDGTVSANKNSIKIIGEATSNYAQGYFVYDSKKAGSMTISHLRFGPHSISAPYLIDRADFVACHQFAFLQRAHVLDLARPGAIFLLNSPYDPDEVWNHLPAQVRHIIRERQLRFYIINARRVAQEAGLGGRINTIMQTCFFALSGVLLQDQAIAAIKASITKTYGKRGEAVVQRNWQAVDAALAHLFEVRIPAAEEPLHAAEDQQAYLPPTVPANAQRLLEPLITGEGNAMPVSAFPIDGTYPSATARWEKRNLATEIPAWETDICIQCGKCAIVCPHAAIRTKVYDAADLVGAPATFHATEARFKEFPGKHYTLQVAPEDCTSCGLCVEACPVIDKLRPGRKALNMVEQAPLLAQERANWEFFETLPEQDGSQITLGTIKNSQLMEPLFEFSGACAGCGETPYLKLLTQLFGDRAVVANATGCSSIYGGNLPTTPWCMNREGHGPAWSNSLFEDNAEFGLGMRLALDQQQASARELVKFLAPALGGDLCDAILQANQTTIAGQRRLRANIARLKERLQASGNATDPDTAARAAALLSVADTLLNRSLWIVGGDGWAYDIGFGGLDHVLASGANVNVLVMDTEVYSNTGGQASKATPRGAVAKFAARGKHLPKKDLGMLAMAYGYIYVAQVALGANDMQTLKAFLEAEAYDGPSLIIAYSHCIEHGIDMQHGLEQQRLAVQSGYWPLYRYNPVFAAEGKNPFVLDSRPPSVPFAQYAANETRYRLLTQNHDQRAAELEQAAEADIRHRWEEYRQLSVLNEPSQPEHSADPVSSANGNHSTLASAHAE